MKVRAILLALTVQACAHQPEPADTLCTATTRYHATPAQVVAFKSDQSTWEPLVNWLATFNHVRDARCLKPSPS